MTNCKFTVDVKENNLTISIVGDLNFTCRDAFMEIIETQHENYDNCILDLSGVTILDSSGLGMLLILQGHPNFKDKNISITTKDNETITQIFMNHHFHQVFKMA